MNRSLIFGFVLAASVATAAPWSKLNGLNPFKGKKASSQVKTTAAAPAKPAKEQTSATAPAGKPKKEKKVKGDKQRDYAGIYTSGTVAAIPKQTAGRLDLNSTEVLKFSYGKPSWSVAYRKIKTIEVSDRQPESFLRIPKVNERRRTFTIEFFGANDDLQFTTFEIPVKDSYEVLPLLEQRTGKGVAAAGVQTPGAWWGDGIWKTPRNSALWEEASPAKTTTIAQKD